MDTADIDRSSQGNHAPRPFVVRWDFTLEGVVNQPRRLAGRGWFAFGSGGGTPVAREMNSGPQLSDQSVMRSGRPTSRR